MSSSPCLASHWIATFLRDTQPSHFIVALFSNRSLFELDFTLVHRIFFFPANLGKGLSIALGVSPFSPRCPLVEAWPNVGRICDWSWWKLKEGKLHGLEALLSFAIFTSPKIHLVCPPSPPPKKKFTHFATVVIPRRSLKKQRLCKVLGDKQGVLWEMCEWSEFKSGYPGQLWICEAENRDASITFHVHLFGPHSAIRWVIKSLKNCYSYRCFDWLTLTRIFAFCFRISQESSRTSSFRIASKVLGYDCVFNCWFSSVLSQANLFRVF